MTVQRTLHQRIELWPSQPQLLSHLAEQRVSVLADSVAEKSVHRPLDTIHHQPVHFVVRGLLLEALG